MLKRLDEFKIGETGLIKKVEGEGRLRRRLFDMGVTPGATVFLRKKAPYELYTGSFHCTIFNLFLYHSSIMI